MRSVDVTDVEIPTSNSLSTLTPSTSKEMISEFESFAESLEKKLVGNEDQFIVSVTRRIREIKIPLRLSTPARKSLI